VPVYSPAFAGNHFASPGRGGKDDQTELTWNSHPWPH